MKNTLMIICSLIIFCRLSAQSNQVVCSGQVMRNVNVTGTITQIPYADVRVLLVNTAQGAIKFDNSICSAAVEQKFSGFVRSFTTDSKGNYYFSYPYNPANRYCIVICNGSKIMQISIPASAKGNIIIPTQSF